MKTSKWNLAPCFALCALPLRPVPCTLPAPLPCALPCPALRPWPWPKVAKMLFLRFSGGKPKRNLATLPCPSTLPAPFLPCTLPFPWPWPWSPKLRDPARVPHVCAVLGFPRKLQAGLRTNSAGIPYTLLLRTEAIGFPTFGLLPCCFKGFTLQLRVHDQPFWGLQISPEPWSAVLPPNALNPTSLPLSPQKVFRP